MPSNYNLSMDTLPPADSYGMEYARKDRYEEFQDFYEANKNTPFNFREAIYEYTKSDVTLLRKSCMRFDNILIGLTNVAPFHDCITLGSVSLRVYNTNFLGSHRIGVIGDETRMQRVNQSKLALAYMAYLTCRYGYKIRNRQYMGEARVKTFFLDGLILNHPQCDELRGDLPVGLTINGCYYHGCLKQVPFLPNICFRCFEGTRPFLDSGLTMADKALETERRDKAVTEALQGRHIIIYEHEIRERLNASKDMADFFKQYTPLPQLKCRDAFTGGRVGPIKLYHRIAPGEKILHIDLVSLNYKLQL
jgi:hypothetical protein